MIFAIADIHSNIKRLKRHTRHIERKIGRKLNQSDTLVCLGDFIGASAQGTNAQNIQHADNSYFLRYVSKQPYSVVCVIGNHDNKRKLKKLSGKRETIYGDEVLRIAENIVYLQNGHVYEIPIDNCSKGEPRKSVRVLAAGGAFGHLYRFKGATKRYATELAISYLDFLYNDEHIEVDYVLAHDAPMRNIGKIIKGLFGITPMNLLLEQVMNKTSFSKWLFGHHHLDYESDDGRFQCIYNRCKILSIEAKDEPKKFTQNH